MDHIPKNEAEAREQVQSLKENLPTQHDKLDLAINGLTNIANRYENVFLTVSSVLSDILQKDFGDVETTLNILSFYKKYSHKCKGECIPHFLMGGLLACVYDDATLLAASDFLLETIRTPIYCREDFLATMVETIRDLVVPKMKSFAENKCYSKALRLWRALVKFTRFERVPTTVTNKILHVATIAFKETDANVHIDAFHSWRIFIERLPEATVKKPNYIALLLNPLNRNYRETDAATVTQKYSAWWQLVLSLGAHIDTSFDQVVVPLLQKLFHASLSRSHQPTTEAGAHPLSQEAYVAIALLLYTGGHEILKEMSGLHEQMPVNQYVLNNHHFVRNSTLVQAVLDVVVSNIVGQSSSPSETYSYLLLKILLSRAGSLYDIDGANLSKAFMRNVLKLLKATRLDAEQSLSVFTDVANGLPQSLLTTPHSADESPIFVFTAFFIEHVGKTCSRGTENQRKRFKNLLRLLLVLITDFLPFMDYVVSHFADIDPLFEVAVWTELVERLLDEIARSRETEQTTGPNFGAVIKTLRYPFRKTSCLTAETVKLWCKLFTAFSKHAVLTRNVQNEHIEDVCAFLLKDLVGSTDITLNCLLLYSHALESVAKQTTLDGASDTGKPLGDLESLVKCLSTVAEKASQFIADVKQSRSDAQCFVNVVSIFDHLVRNSTDPQLLKELCNVLIPHVLVLFENSRTKNVIRETCLSHVDGPLTNALGQLSEELVNKSLLINDDSRFAANMKSLLTVASSHWKRSIRDNFCTYANFISASAVDEGAESSSQNFSQFLNIPEAVAVLPPKPSKPSATSRGSPITTHDKTSTKRRTSRKNSRTADDEEFTPIKSVKKRAIFTEHQLEKQAELKVIPSMYQDLSQSIDRSLPQPTADAEVVEPRWTFSAHSIAADEDAVSDVDLQSMKSKATPAGGDEESCKKLKIDQSFIGDTENDEGVVAEQPTKSASDDLQIEGIRPIDSPEPGKILPSEGVNNENDEPVAKKKKRFSYNGEDEMPDSVEIDEKPSSLVKMAEKIQQQQLMDRGEVEPARCESPMRTFGSRKRKLGQNFESPILMRMSPKSGFLANSPSSRSRKMLEAAQAKQSCQTDIRHMLAGSTPRHNNVFQLHENVSSPRTSTFTPPTNGNGGVGWSSPSARRSILKKFSTGTSAKRVSFSKSNEVCSFVKHPRISTAKSLFRPVTVNDDHTTQPTVNKEEGTANFGLCEKSFHEDLEDSPQKDETLYFDTGTADKSVHLELPADEDEPVKKVLFEDLDCSMIVDQGDTPTDLRNDKDEFVDAAELVEDIDSVKESTPDKEAASTPEAATAEAPPAEMIGLMGKKSAEQTKATARATMATAAGASTRPSTTARQTCAEKLANIAHALTETDLVSLIKRAEEDQRKQVLAHVSSPEFLATMSSSERNSFAIRVFASIGFYVQ